jgi:SAM-dependent methyltransferase
MNKHPGMSLQGFEDQYKGQAPWDIGQPQKAFVNKFAENLPESPVLEIGCGSGDLSLFIASKGCGVLGIDFSQEAIGRAKIKAHETGSGASFEVRDAFSLQQLGKRFASVLDCCFFHVLDDPSRKKYEEVLREIMSPGGMVYMLYFAIALPHPGAPRAISKPDIEQTFGNGWTIMSAVPSVVEITPVPQGLPGIFAVIKREDDLIGKNEIPDLKKFRGRIDLNIDLDKLRKRAFSNYNPSPLAQTTLR